MKTTQLLRTLCLSLVILAGLMLLARAVPLTLAWEDDQPGMMKYELYRGIELLGTTTEKTLIIDGLAAGDVLHVLAVNIAGLRSLPSEVLTILPEHFPPVAPTGLKVVIIETSSNLTEWKPLAYIPLDPNKQAAQFIRASIAQN